MLLSAIRHALERSRVTLAHELEIQELRDCYGSPTPREPQVMALVVSGLLNKQIGGELGIREITVKAHRGQVMHKMKAILSRSWLKWPPSFAEHERRRLVFPRPISEVDVQHHSNDDLGASS